MAYISIHFLLSIFWIIRRHEPYVTGNHGVTTFVYDLVISLKWKINIQILYTYFFSIFCHFDVSWFFSCISAVICTVSVSDLQSKDTHSYVCACEISAAFLMFSARHYSRRSNLTTYSPKIFKLGEFVGQIKELNMVSCLIIFNIYMGIVILKHVMLIR